MTPKHVINFKDHPDWDPFSDYDNFSLALVCQSSDCGEPVFVIVSTDWVDDVDDDQRGIIE